MLLRALAERLALFGRIDPGEPDLVLLTGIVEDSERIAVGDADDFAEKLRRVRCPGQEQQQKQRKRASVVR